MSDSLKSNSGCGAGAGIGRAGSGVDARVVAGCASGAGSAGAEGEVWLCAPHIGAMSTSVMIPATLFVMDIVPRRRTQRMAKRYRKISRRGIGRTSQVIVEKIRFRADPAPFLRRV